MEIIIHYLGLQLTIILSAGCDSVHVFMCVLWADRDLIGVEESTTGLYHYILYIQHFKAVKEVGQSHSFHAQRGVL